MNLILVDIHPEVRWIAQDKSGHIGTYVEKPEKPMWPDANVWPAIGWKEIGRGRPNPYWYESLRPLTEAELAYRKVLIVGMDK